MSRRAGVTLIEVLVVVSILAVLAAILLPALARARSQARGVQCLSNLRQIASAFHAYADANDGTLPDEWSGLTWDALIFPHLPAEGVYLCPADPTAEDDETSYEWRDRFQVPADKPLASLGGAKLASILDTSVVLTFETAPARHAADHLGTAAVDTSTRMLSTGDFNADMARAVVAKPQGEPIE